MNNICEKCKHLIGKCKEKITKKIIFDYANRPIVKKRIVKNIEGWGSFPNKCIEITFADGKKDYRSLDNEFYDTPQLHFSSGYIVRKSDSKDIMEIFETLQHGFIVLSRNEYIYIPENDDILSLGFDEDYKHPFFNQ